MEAGIAEARSASAESRWIDTVAAYAHTDGELNVDDLDRLATAAFLTGDKEAGFRAWGQAHSRCLDDASVHRAAHFGMRLAQCLIFTGDLPRSRGWVDRTARLLEDTEIDCVEQGYLDHALGMCRIFEAGDLPDALAHFERAAKIAARFGDRELATLARIGVGRMRIYLGEPGDGLGHLDEAMISIEAGELSAVTTGDAFCTVIDACVELSDIGRCRAWTDAMVRWCDRHQGMILYRGHCLLHRAEVLAVMGRWPDALSEARQAVDRLADPLPLMLGAARAVEADLLRNLGDHEAAEAAYTRANELGHEPQPGLALLRRDQGKTEVADVMIRRVLNQTDGPLARSRMLPAFAEIALDCGDVAAGKAAAEELRVIAATLSSATLSAEAARARGAALLADEQPTQALAELRRAFRSFTELAAGPRAAHTRLLIAEACEQLGDHDTATIERTVAAAALDSFRAGADTEANAARTVAEAGMTGRELEVLRLLASGSTNRVIGEQLFISEKTVASHISHIFTKLGVTSRAAATAYAYDNNLT